MGTEATEGTEGKGYTERLEGLSNVWWKRALNTQAPYHWKLRRADLGRTLEIGCGIGRLLGALPFGSMGVDHNPASVAHCCGRGLPAMTTAEFFGSDAFAPDRFDSLLMAHLLEHLTLEDAAALVESYLPALRPGGKVLIICPQERGYASDPTHVTFFDGPALENFCRGLGLQPSAWESFPLPRAAGTSFTYNEFHVLARKP